MQNSKAVGYFVCWENLRDRIALRLCGGHYQSSHPSLQREQGVEQKGVKTTDCQGEKRGQSYSQTQLSLGMELAPTQRGLLVYTGRVGKVPRGHSVPTEGCDLEK